MVNTREQQFQSKPFFCRIYGDYALFTDPATKGGGEKYTYSLPTFEALRGIISAAYWKPTLEYIIDEVKVLNPIRSQTKGILVPLNKGGQDRYYYTYLSDVAYGVKFHFEWNMARKDLDKDRDEIKHTQILLRSLERGGRRDIFLGTRECLGYIERLRREEYEALASPYEGQQLDFGTAFHSFNYPKSEEKGESLTANFDRVQLINGILSFRRPEDTEIHHAVTDYQIPDLAGDSIETADETLHQPEYREE
ncbi:CRISPR-associated protein Cas5, subtype I-C/DVULG [Aedoeadaptatus ivorii]|uniref:pre-crRNA processing endonuclease n=1 Tax=Aedoeadaptatus ivorii TaxID=54006 RepID=A0A3S5AKH5_9FIRM|nr:type I-C CRISPR-associated protein Cas5c [Peptoniphilus ivorii]VEJ36342.1 CRISPR-associated protein Cas5, subtype I-C/DVULG [Peptoniphilus ivorii]